MKLLATALLGLVFALPASAAQITTFAQTSGTNTIIATDNGVNTHIGATDAVIDVAQLFGNPSFPSAFFNLMADSVSAAITVAGHVIQSYSGSFSITTGAGGTGTNLLSGVFTDAAFGALGGPGLTLNVNNPPDTLTLTSSVIPASDLGAPSTFDLGFSNLTPTLHLDGSTIAAFTASVAGDVSASIINVPEPGSIAVLGIGLIGLGILRRRTRRA